MATLCALSNCNKRASYYMGVEEGRGVRRGIVCATHDRWAGRRNLAAWKPWMSRADIIEWDNKFCKHPDLKALDEYVSSVDPEDCLE
jgi:hypothetical protein